MTTPAETELIAETAPQVAEQAALWAVSGVAGAILLIAAALAIAYVRVRRRVESIAAERDAAVIEAREAATARRTLRYQSKLLGSLIPGIEPEQTLHRFLKTLLPRLDGGFAAIIDRLGAAPTVLVARGTVPKAARLDRFEQADAKTWAADAILSGSFLVPAGDRYAVLTTQLGPADIPKADAREVLMECRDAIAAVSDSHSGEVAHSDELRMTKEMLALHEIAGRVGDDPDEVLCDYLEMLVKHQSYDRVALFLTTTENGKRQLNRIANAGRQLAAGAESTALDHELKLSAHCEGEQTYFGRKQLDEAGVDSLFGSALVVPLTRTGRPCGVLCLTSASPVTHDATESRLLGWASRHLVVVLEGLRDRVSMERRATRDGLTGLLNRAELDRRIAIGLAEAEESRPCTLILFDLDRFKRVNDAYGHIAGDAALCHVSAIMQSVAVNSRADDQITVARYGGEELCILMPKAGLSAGLRIADQVRREVATTPFQHDGRRIPLTISAGVATAPQHGTDATRLLAAADASLYTSKQLGRNRVTDASSIQSLEALKDAIQRQS